MIYLIASHRSGRTGHQATLECLALVPLLDLDLGWGGDGGLPGMGLVQASIKILTEMATFDEAGVTERLKLPPMTRTVCVRLAFLTAIPISRTHHADGSGVGVIDGLVFHRRSRDRRPGGVGRCWLALVDGSGGRQCALIVLLVLLTRGLHQDGLADTVDGLAGGRTVEDRLRIMRDPRVGAFGATAWSFPVATIYGVTGAACTGDCRCCCTHAGAGSLGDG